MQPSNRFSPRVVGKLTVTLFCIIKFHPTGVGKTQYVPAGMKKSVHPHGWGKRAPPSGFFGTSGSSHGCGENGFRLSLSSSWVHPQGVGKTKM
jgi:hypothetical protein